MTNKTDRLLTEQEIETARKDWYNLPDIDDTDWDMFIADIASRKSVAARDKEWQEKIKAAIKKYLKANLDGDPISMHNPVTVLRELLEAI